MQSLRNKAISEYEKFEDIFVKGKSKRTDIIDHSFNASKRDKNRKWAESRLFILIL